MVADRTLYERLLGAVAAPARPANRAEMSATTPRNRPTGRPVTAPPSVPAPDLQIPHVANGSIMIAYGYATACRLLRRRRTPELLAGRRAARGHSAGRQPPGSGARGPARPAPARPVRPPRRAYRCRPHSLPRRPAHPAGGGAARGRARARGERRAPRQARNRRLHRPRRAPRAAP